MKLYAKIVFISLLVVLFSCRKDPDYPDKPEIGFKDFQTFGKDSAILTITFKDGDGDIGLKKEDTLPPYDEGSVNYYNLFLEYYEYVNGKRVRQQLIPPFYYRIQYIKNEGRIKDLEGDISVSLSPFYYDPFSPADTFSYSIMIKDRALHKSNVVFTSKLVKP